MELYRFRNTFSVFKPLMNINLSYKYNVKHTVILLRYQIGGWGCQVVYKK